MVAEPAKVASELPAQGRKRNKYKFVHEVSSEVSAQKNAGKKKEGTGASKTKITTNPQKAELGSGARGKLRSITLHPDPLDSVFA